MDRLRPFLVALVLAFIAAPVFAGPWPRETGRWFVSSSVELPASHDWRPFGGEVYTEFGLRPRVTLATSLAWRSAVDRIDMMIRWHPPDLANELRWGITGGMRYVPTAAIPIQGILGAELGRGQQIGRANLWAEAGLWLHAGHAPWGIEGQATVTTRLGLRQGRWLAMLAVSHTANRFAQATRFRPALGVEFGRSTILVEGELATGGQVLGARLGLWQQF